MPHLPRTFTGGAVIFLATCILLYIYSRIYYFPQGPERDITLNHAYTAQSGACTIQEHLSTIWERNSLLRQKCTLAKHHHVSTNVTFYHWKNLNYCKVPKCGSTFWMQVFLTLKKVKSVEDVFGNRRNRYHTIVMNKTSTWDHLTTNDVIFHVTRNPYSRLYSAYIDKIYLPGFWKFTKQINEKNDKDCSHSVRFGEFLEYILKENVQDPHWQPVSELCGSCRVPYNVISKQETFNNDVRFILNHLSISGLLKKEVLKNLQKKHTENSIKEITPIMIELANLDPCLTFMQFSQRLWKSFQIQGYISDLISFPANSFRNLNFSNVSAILNIYLKGSQEIVMTGVMKKLQRRKHLSRAYEGISRKTIKNLRRKYKTDFELYGYSFELPRVQ